jgi:hypothetical protein
MLLMLHEDMASYARAGSAVWLDFKRSDLAHMAAGRECQWTCQEGSP